MRFALIKSPLALLSSLLAFSSLTRAERMLTADSLNPCSNGTGFTSTLFNVAFTPDNGTLTYNINAISSISGKVTAQIQVIAYGFIIYNETINPCNNADLSQLCPLTPGTISLNSNSQFSSSVVDGIPSITYGVPDLDGLVRVYIRNETTNEELACVEAQMSNGKSVDLTAVQWATAVIAGLALLASAVTSGLGHSNTAAHVAANALSLFGFFQAQAIIGMTSVPLPPIVQSWTQDFEWSMGMVSIGFMQNVMTWYQRSTGGTPSTILQNLGSTSVEVQKRAVAVAERLVRRGFNFVGDLSYISRRDVGSDATAQVTIVSGITRVGFRAGIEPTNIFLTGLGFFVAFIVIVAICVSLFKVFCELAAKHGWIKNETFEDFRNGWKIVLKGILFRIVLIGYPQMTILCLWELTVRDSAAEVVLALFYFLAMSICLAWAAFKVIRIAQRSVQMHKNPAYILYSDPAALNKWGFLYVQFRATAYYFIFPLLVYILLKGIFIAFAQGSPIAMTIGLLIIEALWLIAVCVLRPWMDKKTNSFNISIAIINFLNVIFLLFFTDVFNLPAMVVGIMGVIFFGYNAVFALVLLIMVIVASAYAIFSKNPDTRYQPMRDDRGSFIKSSSNLNTELDALGATARGDMRMKRDLDSDSDSFSSTMGRQQDASHVPLPASVNASTRDVNAYGMPPSSPIDPSAPFIPADGGPRHRTPGGYSDNPNYGYPDNRGNNAYRPARSMNSASPLPRFNNYQPYDRSQSLRSGSPSTFAPPNNAGTQWQRGAGYDH